MVLRIPAVGRVWVLGISRVKVVWVLRSHLKVGRVWVLGIPQWEGFVCPGRGRLWGLEVGRGLRGCLALPSWSLAGS